MWLLDEWRLATTASRSFTCGPAHQLLRIKLSHELTIPTKVCSTMYPVPAYMQQSCT